MNKGVCFATACVVLALAAFFIARQGMVNDLRAANHSLQQQIDSQSGPERSVPRMETNSDGPDALGADERNELLRMGLGTSLEYIAGAGESTSAAAAAVTRRTGSQFISISSPLRSARLPLAK